MAVAKLNQGDKVSIINHEGKCDDGYIVVNPKPDKQGLTTLSKDGINIPVHPKRIITGDFKAVKVIQPKEGTTMDAKTEVTVTETETPVTAPVTKVQPQGPMSPAPEQKMSLDELAKVGELWIKSGVNFDHQVSVCACVLIFPDKGKYLSFNMYGGTFGKKGSKPPIDQIIAGTDTGISNVYVIKDLDKLREKQTKNGYKQHNV